MIQVKGMQVTAKRGGETVTRNISHFKWVDAGAAGSPEGEPNHLAETPARAGGGSGAAESAEECTPPMTAAETNVSTGSPCGNTGREASLEGPGESESDPSPEARLTASRSSRYGLRPNPTSSCKLKDHFT